MSMSTQTLIEVLHSADESDDRQDVTNLDNGQDETHSDDRQDLANLTNTTSVSGVVAFLRNNGIPERFCQAFEGMSVPYITHTLCIGTWAWRGKALSHVLSNLYFTPNLTGCGIS